MKIVINLLLVVSLFFGCWKGYEYYKSSAALNELKYDYAEINKINYGLFNVALWKDKIFDIVEKKTEEFDIRPEDVRSFQGQIEDYLYKMHEDYIESGKLIEMLMDNKDNKVTSMLMGMFKGNITKQLENLDFKDRIPSMAEQIMHEFEKKLPELKERITEQVSNMLMESSTSNLVDKREAIYADYGVADLASTNIILKEKVAELNKGNKTTLIIILACLALAIVLLLVSAKVIGFRTAMSWLTVVCIVFLTLGLSLPMIDLDARLSDVDLALMGENIHFDEQVMYFQSKSIFDVTRTLIQGRGIDLKIVGLLILVFSIVLPFLKMVLTTCFLYLQSARRSKVAQTIIFYLGKWSMADVFVVAIFMAYIGFYGLLNAQLDSMAHSVQSVAIETINYSSLSPGIIFFTLYCIFSIVMSMLVHRRFIDKELLFS